MSASVQNPALSAVSRPLDAGAAALVVLLCLSWGFNQVAVKLAMADIPPLIQGTIRSGGAALIVWAWTYLRGIKVTVRDGTLGPGLLAGLLFGLEFVLIYRGLLYTTASRAVIFIYTAPFFVVLGSRFLFPGDRFNALQWAGLALSFGGIAVAFGVPEPAADPHQMLGDAMIVFAAIAWAATTLVIKGSSLARAPVETTTLYQLVVSFPVLGIAVLLFGETMTAMPGALAIGSLIYQTAWIASVTFLLWFLLVIRYSASRLSAFTFLTPLFGVAAGHLVMGDPITPAFMAAAAMVIAGLFLVNRPARKA